MKSTRHSKILELIANNPIDTQEELLGLLNKSGFKVTQATVSRDIKELRLIKAQSPDGGYRYTTNASAENVDISFRFHSIFTESVNDVVSSGYIVCVKCYTGMANAACAALDSIRWEGVVGTLAGDDTIFVLMTDDKNAVDFAMQLKKMLDK